MPFTSSMVSVGSPTMKYSLRFSQPLSNAAAKVSSIASSGIALLMTCLSLSVPASGAKVSVVLRRYGNDSINSIEDVSRRRLGKDRVRLSWWYLR